MAQVSRATSKGRFVPATAASAFPSHFVDLHESMKWTDELQFIVLTANHTLNDNNTVQSLFPSTKDSVSLLANTQYAFEGVFLVRTGSTSHTISLSFGTAGGLTISEIFYQPLVNSATADTTLATANTGVIRTVNATVVQGTATSTSCRIRIVGHLLTGGSGGTLNPRVTFSATTGGTCQTAAESFFYIWPTGTGAFNESANVVASKALFENGDTPGQTGFHNLHDQVDWWDDYETVVLLTDSTLTVGTSVQSVFEDGSGNSREVTLQDNSTYYFEGNYWSQEPSTNHSTQLAFGGTATLSAIAYNFWGVAAAAFATPATASGVWVTSAAQTTVTAGNTTQFRRYQLVGHVRVTTGGTFIPQIRYSAGSAGSAIMHDGSFFRIRRIGSDAVEEVGTWS